MSKEIFTYAPLGSTVYAIILRRSDKQIRRQDTTAFEAVNSANWASYDHALTAESATSIFTADLPSLAAGVYDVWSFRQLGGAPATSDPICGQQDFDWTGTADRTLGTVDLATPAEAAGRPATLNAMLRRIWEKMQGGNKQTRDRATGTVLLRNDADNATLETHTQSTAGDVDTLSEGA
jgi:hypothetical protein